MHEIVEGNYELSLSHKSSPWRSIPDSHTRTLTHRGPAKGPEPRGRFRELLPSVVHLLAVVEDALLQDVRDCAVLVGLRIGHRHLVHLNACRWWLVVVMVAVKVVAVVVIILVLVCCFCKTGFL